MAEALSDIVEEINSYTDRVNIYLNGIVGCDNCHALRCDLGRIRSILMNLIRDGMNSKQQRDVGIQVLALPQWMGGIRGQPAGNLTWVRFEIVDSGIDLAESTRSRLLDDLLQPRKSRSPGLRDTGFARSRWLIEQMGGALWLTASQGNEAKLVFEIPLLVKNDER